MIRKINFFNKKDNLNSRKMFYVIINTVEVRKRSDIYNTVIISVILITTYVISTLC